ncbi:MAG: O-antigen ligase family protein, partial [Anaerolineales bacterium]|nr:O-antigen ligase family protein [Anaerolineales bacterium]
MVLVSTWATYDIALSLPKISGMVLGLGVFFAVARESGRARGWWLSLLIFLGFGVGIAGLGVFCTRWFGSKILFFNPITGRFPVLISGLQGAESGFHPNEVAGALTWVLPVLLTLSAHFALSLKISSSHNSEREEYWVSAVTWLSTLFVTAVFILTQSRGSYLALIFTSLALLFIILPPPWRWSLLGVMMITGLIFGFALSKGGLVAAHNWLTGSGLTTEGALSLNSLEGRVELWSRAIFGLQDFPFTGMGMNTFREVVHLLYPLFLIAPDVDIGHAHNEFLQAGLDLGIPGLIAFISLYIIAFWILMDAWRKISIFEVGGRNQQRMMLQRSIVLGLGGGLLAHLIYGMTDAVSLGAKPGVLFWMLLGLIAGLETQMRGRIEDRL